MASKPASPLEELVTCSVCLETFTDAKALPCFHSYCKECLQQLVNDQGKLLCPQCRKEFEVPDGDASNFTSNFLLNNLLEVVSLTDDIETTNIPDTSPGCPTHPDKKCELYCESCSKLVCCHCIAKWGDCHTHSYADVKLHAQNLRDTVKEFSNKGRDLLPKVGRHVGLLEDMKAKQAADLAEVCEKIEATFHIYRTILEDRKNELIQAALKMHWKTMDGFNAELERVQVEKAKLASTDEICGKMLDIDNHVLFIQKYYEVKEKILGMDFPELVSQVEMDGIKFEGNGSLLEDIISSYGCVVRCSKSEIKEEKPVDPQEDEKDTRVDRNAELRQEIDGQPNPRNSAARGNESGSDTLAPAAVERGSFGNAGSSAGNNIQPVFWRLYQKNRNDTFVLVEDRGLSVRSRSPRHVAVIGMPGFSHGKHSWKAKLEKLGTGLGIGVCVGKNLPGVCVMFDSSLTIVSPSIVVAVEVDCEAKRVWVRPEGQLSHTFRFQNLADNDVHPYFSVLSNMHKNGKLTIVEMDGRSVADSESCCIL